MCFVAVKLFVEQTLPTSTVRGVRVWTFGERLHDMQFVELEHPRLQCAIAHHDQQDNYVQC